MIIAKTLAAALLALSPLAPAVPTEAAPLILSGGVVDKFYEPATRPNGIIGWKTGPPCWGVEVDLDDALFNRYSCVSEADWGRAVVGRRIVAVEQRHAFWRHFNNR